jgi:hypothetical protein
MAAMTSLARRPLPSLRVAGFLLLWVPLAGHSVESLEGRIGAISGDDWRVSGLAFSLHLDGSSVRGTVRIEALELPSAGLSFADVAIDCGRIALAAAEFACLAAEFTVDLPGVGRESFSGEARYERASGMTRFNLRNIPLAGGRAAVRGSATEAHVDLEFSGESLELGGLAGIAERIASGPPGLSAGGTVNLNGSLRIEDNVIAHGSMTAELMNAAVSNEAGTLVADAMHALIDLTAGSDGSLWQFAVDVQADAGEAYVEPVYANLGENTLTFSATGRTTDEFTDVELSSFTFKQGLLIEVTGDLSASMETESAGTTLSGSIELGDSSADAIYSGLLQVLLAGTLAGDLEIAGTVAGKVLFEDNELTAVTLALRELSLDDKQGRFAVYGLDGNIHWPGAEGEAHGAKQSRLRWDNGSAYDIPLGPGELEARLGGDDFHLSTPLRVPTMGGALLLKQLVLNDFGTADASGLLDAELEPIELAQLTSAFGWPGFSGQLSGQLPLLQYDRGVVTVGGSLTASAFGGAMEFANLRLEEPLGLVPRLYGDLRLRRLDLEQLTDTFSFGLIQGRLSGDVTGLQMIAWRPVAMDLHLYTPPGDPARRRISQRAVENLASVGGGGAAAALSSGFMKFFEEFSYESIGIRCVLRDGTCSMSGVGPAGESEFGQGYYIVKGSGLPRIDVVGYRHQVSWNALVRQLDAITASGAPVVR